MRCGILFLGVVALICGAYAEEGCGQCEKRKCPPITEANCVAGTTDDKCGCCKVCARGYGESCDLPNEPYSHGKCGAYLRCHPTEDGLNVCECVHPTILCGTDGKIYHSLCELRAAKVSHKVSDLKVDHEGPCRSKPVIISAPQYTKVDLNGNVSLSCEATGFPVPLIAWLFTNVNKDTESLPGNNMNTIVVTSGGPEEYQQTGWVQIQKITATQEGDYTCVVQNKLGSVTGSARITVRN